MKRSAIGVWALACSIGCALPCFGQANPFNGSWKIDPASVKYEGPTMTMTTDAEGYTITRQGKPGPKTICDGKPHKDPSDGAMVTCTKSGTGYLISVSENGKLRNKVSATLSADGKTMTRTNHITPEDGSAPYTMTNTYERVSGGPGMNGEWKAVSFKESQDKGILTIQVNGDNVAFKETDNDKPVMLKIDGTPVKFMNGTMAVKMAGPRTMKVIYTDADGQMRRDNTFEVSADGKTLTETDLTPDPSPSKMSMTFHKM